MTDHHHDLDVKDRADRALRAGAAAESLALYSSLLRKVDVTAPGVYEGWLLGALAAYQALGRRREGGYILMALRRFAEAEPCFDPHRLPLEWALCAEKQGRPREAARALAAAGHTALAAIALEEATDWAGARRAWQDVLAEDRLRGRRYEEALVRFNLGSALRRLGDAEASRLELLAAQRMLEDLADGFETAGETDRAFACYSVLLRLGRDTGSFENVAEGYLNAIRLLARGDYQHDAALEHCEDFLELAASANEWHAAARIAEDAADLSARLGLVYERHYRHRAASLWHQAARANAEAGGPPAASENALVTAVEAAASAGDAAFVGALYGALAELPLTASRKERYAALASRSSNLAGADVPPAAPGFPRQFRREIAYPELWRQDLVDWDLGGRPVPVLAQLVAEGLGLASSERHALRALLLCVEERFSWNDPVTAAELAVALGQVMAYEVLRPLRDLASHPAARVRAAAMGGVGKVPDARSIAIIRVGLDDRDETVRIEARRALRAMGFRSGLSQLVRFFRESRDEIVRQTLVDAIADIDGLEAGLFLLDLVRGETGPLAELAAKRVRRSRCAELWPILRRAAQDERGPTRAALEELLRWEP